MTRGQQIIEEVKRIIAEAHKKGDNDPMADVVVTLSFTLGAEWADRTMIEKACEWLREQLQNTTFNGEPLFCEIEETLEDFRKAMKGE